MKIKVYILSILLLFFVLIIFIALSCFDNSSHAKVQSTSVTLSLLDPALANGFDFPVGNADGKGSYQSLMDGKTYDSWYIATKTAEEYSLGIHTGEDWNGSGGGNADLGQPVYATAQGKVIHAAACPSPWGNVILIEHRYLENNEVKIVYSQYAHLKEMSVKKGETVARRQKIASIGQGSNQEYPAHLHFEIRKAAMKDFPADYWPSSKGKTVAWVKQYYESPSDFIRHHRNLLVPYAEKKFILAEKSNYKMHVYSYGVLKKTYEIALGQQPVGRKEKQGDLKVPEGQYWICEKTKVPFDASTNWSNAYLGPRWLRVSYPNQFDAQNGFEKKLITKVIFDKISSACKTGKMPPQNTSLGGGIGIHGWIESDWKNEGSRALTWGCISMHNNDLKEFYDIVEMNTPLVIIK